MGNCVMYKVLSMHKACKVEYRRARKNFLIFITLYVTSVLNHKTTAWSRA